MTASTTNAAELASISPVSGELIETFVTMSSDQLDSALEAAVAAQVNWRDVAMEKRSLVMRALAEQPPRARTGELSALITREMGKPIAEAAAEVEKCAVTAEWMAEHAADLLAPEALDPTPARNLARFRPLGCVLAIMPGTIRCGRSCGLPSPR